MALKKLLDIPAQTPANEVDEEILEIFIEEVGEVSGEIVSSFEAWRDNPQDQEALKVLRRNFHTLKGSGRLVGATAIGELGWRFESLLNQVLEGTIPRTNHILTSISRVEDVLFEMIEQFKNTQPISNKAWLLISQVDHLIQTKGKSLGEFAMPDGTVTQEEKPQELATEELDAELAKELENIELEKDFEEPVATEETITDKELATESLDEMDLEGFDLEETEESATDKELATESLEEMDLEGFDLEETEESATDKELATESLDEMDLEGFDLEETEESTTDKDTESLEEMDLEGFDLEETEESATDKDTESLEEMDLEGFDLEEPTTTEETITDKDLEGFDLEEPTATEESATESLEEVDLEGFDLEETEESTTDKELATESLEEMDLEGFDLEETEESATDKDTESLEEMDLEGFDLEEPTTTEETITDKDLEGFDLEETEESATDKELATESLDEMDLEGFDLEETEESATDKELATESLDEMDLEGFDFEEPTTEESATDKELATESLDEMDLEGFDFEAELSEDLASLEETEATDSSKPLTAEQETLDEIDKLEEKLDAAAKVIEELVESTTTEVDSPVTTKEEDIDPILFGIFQKEAQQHLATLQKFLVRCEQETPVQVEHEIVRAFHTLTGSSRTVNFLAIATISAPLENYSDILLEKGLELKPEMVELFHTAVTLISQLVKGEKIDLEQQQTLLDNVQMSIESLPTTSPKSSSKPPEIIKPTSTTEVVSDAGDEFMSIFLEEAEEILENSQSLLERWQTAPNNMQLIKELQRELHTLKGGSRMVGITPMGDLSHHLESVLTRIVEGTAQSSNKLQEVVQNSVDELAAMLEAVRSNVPLEIPSDLIKQINTTLDHPEGSEPATKIETVTPVTSATQAAGKTPPSANQDEETRAEAVSAEKAMIDKETDGDGSGEDRIRVRVALIDKLTNLAGELSILRAHMEQQQGAIRNNLSEMEQTVVRLRDQLRRLEIETEAQILSHFGSPSLQGSIRLIETGMQILAHPENKKGNGQTPPSNYDEEFDPLELDRFSVMQQLSRSLMESISDLTNIQETLKTLTRQTDALLVQQTRVGGELQDGIMRTRMVPFSRISPRLQRIARLTARELRKQVEFVLEGESIEFERTVLNRIVAPLEHMLRNAIGHGIEDAETRQQAGKATIAKVIVDIYREGTELVLKVSDDGAGLNLPAIRKKAEERKMIKAGSVISDQELMQFILEPSFSTAKTITQVSGRGVGMDVVNSEIKQLGGSLQIMSKTGEGTVFEIHLPVSLTISQALLVHLGEETIAVPLNHVDAVMRTPRHEVLPLEGQYDFNAERYYPYMDHQYRIFHLGELLGMGRIASLDSALIPTLLVRVGNRRMALLVDGIEGSKEVVVKSVGPQIGAIRWIAGATILGDGRVVIILDMPTLTRLEAPAFLKHDTATAISPKEEKVAAAIIMVVDDSITVRKVTARLLQRQGMEVLTAKDGVDAVAQLQEHIPDLMLLDVEMPRMDGYELAAQVRNTPDLKHIPIIMITSRTGTKHRDKAEKIGIDRYLGKPFNETELLENINALLKSGRNLSSG